MQSALLQLQQSMQQQQHLQQLVAVQQLQRQQQHKQQVKQQQAVKPPQIGVDFSKVAPDVLEGFVNVCPTCGIHSFFSPISLELHKNICAKVLQHEWISYSKISMLTSTRLILPTDQKTDEPETSASPTLHKSMSERSLSSPIENHQSTPTSTPSFEQLGVYQNFGQNLLGKTPRSVCHICNKKFRNSLQLEIHVKKTHGDNSDLRPHKCPICPARFKVSGTLVTHLRTHTGERPFPCDQCGKTFSQKSALTRHKMIHTGEKPFECTICDSKFRYKDALQSHEFKYHKIRRTTSNSWMTNYEGQF